MISNLFSQRGALSQICILHRWLQFCSLSTLSTVQSQSKIDPIEPAADRILSLLRGNFPKPEPSLAHSRAPDFSFIGDWSALPHAYTFLPLKCLLLSPNCVSLPSRMLSFLAKSSAIAGAPPKWSICSLAIDGHSAQFWRHFPLFLFLFSFLFIYVANRNWVIMASHMVEGVR